MRPVRVFLVDDSESFRVGAANWLASHDELDLVGTAPSGEEALDRIARLRPDVVLVDMVLGGISGLEVTRRLKSPTGAPQVVVITLHDSQVARAEAWAAGADGFIPKARFAEQVLPILRRLTGGDEGEDQGQGPRLPASPARPGPHPRDPETTLETGALAPIDTGRGIVRAVLRAIRGGKEPTMTRQTLKTTGLAMLVLILAAGVSLAGGPSKTEFVPMGDHDLVPIDITADGSTIVGIGYFGAPHFTWTRDGGYTILGGGCGSGQPSISGDGSTIIGCTIDENQLQVAAKWIGGTEWQSLGSVEGAVPCDAFFSSTWDVDDAGTTAVGLVWLAQQCRAHAGAWDLVSGGPATDLGSLSENRASRANGISGDGRVIVGWQDSEFGSRQGAKWVDGVESMIVTEAGEFVGEVMDINSDGSVMVGLNYPYGSGDGWLWTAKSGFKAIPGLQIFSQVIPVGVSEDGSVVVGIVRDNNGNQKPFFFTKGKLTFGTDYLAKKRLAEGWQVRAFSLVSRDGSQIAGWGINPDGFIEGFLISNFR